MLEKLAVITATIIFCIATLAFNVTAIGQERFAFGKLVGICLAQKKMDAHAYSQDTTVCPRTEPFQ